MNYIFGHLVSSQVDINIDDLLAHTADIDSHFVLLREIFDRARRHRLKFAVHKTRLFHSETKFCGKLYSAAGIRHDPERINGVLELPEPSTAAELMQFLCSLNWMRSSIMRYSELVHPLQHLLNHSLSITTRLNSREASKIRLAGLWTEEHRQAWIGVRDALLHSVQLSHPKNDWTLNYFSDASDRVWAVVVTQTPPEQDVLPITDRNHEPLAFQVRPSIHHS